MAAQETVALFERVQIPLATRLKIPAKFLNVRRMLEKCRRDYLSAYEPGKVFIKAEKHTRSLR